MSEWNEFDSSESPCLPNASHQVSAQSDLQLGSRCRFKIFKIATILERKDLEILNLHVTPMPPTKFCFNLTYHFGADIVLKIFKMATMAAILDIGTEEF